MSDNIENLILEQLRGLRNQMASMQSDRRTEFSEVKHCINRLESAVAGIRGDEPRVSE